MNTDEQTLREMCDNIKETLDRANGTLDLLLGTPNPRLVDETPIKLLEGSVGQMRQHLDDIADQASEILARLVGMDAKI